MSEITWIKVAVETFNDEKMKLLQSMPDGDAIVVIWFRLLMQAGKSNSGGLIQMSNGKPYSLQMLSVLFDRTPTVMEFAFRTFIEFGMIEETEFGFYIVNWEKHQNIDGMEKVREQNRIRKQRQREKTRLISSSTVESHGTSHVTSHENHATDKEIEIDKDKDIDKKSKRRTKTPAPQKIKYADNVSMTAEEYEKLFSEFGAKGVERMIDKLSNHKGAKGTTYKSDYLAIRNWVVDWYNEQIQKETRTSAANPNNNRTGSDKPNDKYNVFYQLYQQS